MKSTSTKARESKSDCPPPVPCPCPCPDDPAAPAELPTERNRFFTGKYMTARDFRDEQSYFLGRHRLHQWALHGWGIVVGLDVCPHPNEDCRNKGWLVITPGIAVDCYGRDIVLNEAISVKIDEIFPDDIACGWEAEKGTWNDELQLHESPRPPEPVNQAPDAEHGNDDHEKVQKRRGEKPTNGDDRDPLKGTYLLGIRYGEVCLEPVPLLYDEANCGHRQTHNRIGERPCIRYQDYGNENGCWLTDIKHDCKPKPCPSPCENLSDAAELLKPECPCGASGFIPLVRFRFLRDEQTGRIVMIHWEFDGRRYLRGPLHPHTLTHICELNWKHNAVTPLSDLVRAYLKDPESAEEPDRKIEGKQARKNPDVADPQKDCNYIRLTIRFDDALHPDMPDEEKGRGIYSSILQVHYEEADGDRETCEIERVHLAEERRVLHCDIGMRRWIKKAYEKVSMHVTLNCDFLKDRKGRPVDGEHLLGQLPTGNGVEGGIFQSWFVIDLNS